MDSGLRRNDNNGLGLFVIFVSFVLKTCLPDAGLRGDNA